MPSTRFAPEINQLRAVLRGKHDAELLAALRRHIETIEMPVLVADNSSRYIAANAAACELTGFTASDLYTRTVNDLTPASSADDAQHLWEDFISHGAQRGEYDIRGQRGRTVRVRYWAFASVAPGIHVSVLVPIEPRLGV